MPNENRISATLLDADKTAVLAAITTIRTKLTFLLSLTPAERQGLPTIKEGNRSFHEKCAAYMASRPDLIPSFVSQPEFTKDKATFAQLLEISQALGPLAQDLEDTLARVGHELIMPEFAYYQNVQNAAKAGVPGAKAIHDDLKTRFPGHRKTTPATPTT
jgi:hypothetical protein